MVRKKTTENVYVLVHFCVGIPLVFGGLISLLSRDAGMFYALGLLALGIVQIPFGLVGVLAPDQYRLKNNQLPLIWLGFSIGYGVFMYWIDLDYFSLGRLNQFLWFGVPPFIGLFQIVTFTYKGFKR